MTRDELHIAVLTALASVAPEVEEVKLDSAAAIRDQLDIDSMDFLNFITALHAALGVEVPEKDYSALATVDGCVRYLSSRLGKA
jgi:acyl carrier protein